MNVFLLLLFLTYVSANFIMENANISVWLSAASYCGKDNYSSMILNGPAIGFVMKYIIDDPKTDLQGYVGLLPSSQKIFVVFRGSSSTRNWIEDFKVAKTNYTSYPYCNCYVHAGFYESTMNIVDDTMKAVITLRRQYKYDVISTGHSYGAAVCLLFSIELILNDIPNSVYNFGQPRVGNIDFAFYVNSMQKNLWRFTHNRDIVPHLPPVKGFDYYHSCQEVFENEKGYLTMCIQCEDENCADQYDLADTNTEDHSVYLGHTMNCESSTQ